MRCSKRFEAVMSTNGHTLPVKIQRHTLCAVKVLLPGDHVSGS